MHIIQLHKSYDVGSWDCRLVWCRFPHVKPTEPTSLCVNAHVLKNARALTFSIVSCENSNFPGGSWKRTDSSSGKVYCAASSEKMSKRIMGVIGLRLDDTTVEILRRYEHGIPQSCWWVDFHKGIHSNTFWIVSKYISSNFSASIDNLYANCPQKSKSHFPH